MRKKKGSLSEQRSPWTCVGHVTNSLLFTMLFCIKIDGLCDLAKSRGATQIRWSGPLAVQGSPGT